MKRAQWIGILIILAVVVLPTGIEDIFTTVPLIKILGFDLYLKVALTVLAIVLASGITFKDVEKAVKI